ncbi:hypothetical protein JTE90_010273 [Oedothorax gibbosus]|uniref:Uncharacterized protein n=1 Tax=Oedothorax gibbosus TaxID=931172 RepID=A0AAV6TCN7_9ARAC|nr:hypothetical protein JTE90_010273 [Oedothorax gibbosus]
MRELGLLLLLFIGVILFPSAVYYPGAAGERSHFKSTPGPLFGGGLVTMTRVLGLRRHGAPFGVWGKIVGSCAPSGGVLTIALPVPPSRVQLPPTFYHRETDQEEMHPTNFQPRPASPSRPQGGARS